MKTIFELIAMRNLPLPNPPHGQVELAPYTIIIDEINKIFSLNEAMGFALQFQGDIAAIDLRTKPLYPEDALRIRTFLENDPHGFVYQEELNETLESIFIINEIDEYYIDELISRGIIAIQTNNSKKTAHDANNNNNNNNLSSTEKAEKQEAENSTIKFQAISDLLVTDELDEVTKQLNEFCHLTENKFQLYQNSSYVDAEVRDPYDLRVRLKTASETYQHVRKMLDSFYLLSQNRENIQFETKQDHDETILMIKKINPKALATRIASINSELSEPELQAHAEKSMRALELFKKYPLHENFKYLDTYDGNKKDAAGRPLSMTKMYTHIRTDYIPENKEFDRILQKLQRSGAIDMSWKEEVKDETSTTRNRYKRPQIEQQAKEQIVMEVIDLSLLEKQLKHAFEQKHRARMIENNKRIIQEIDKLYPSQPLEIFEDRIRAIGYVNRKLISDLKLAAGAGLIDLEIKEFPAKSWLNKPDNTVVVQLNFAVKDFETLSAAITEQIHKNRPATQSLKI